MLSKGAELGGNLPPDAFDHRAVWNDRLGRIELPLTQQDIAQSLNASRPRVQQELKRLEREGLIQLGYRRITLLQIKPRD